MKTKECIGFKETEIGLIPEDWEVVKLGDVVDITTGQSAPQGEEYFKNGKYPFIRVSHLSREGYKIISYDLINDKAIKDYNLRIFPKNSIVFPKSGASIFLEKRAKLPFDAYVVSHLCVVNSNSNNLNQDFLFYALINKNLAKDKDSSYPTLNISEIKSILIPLPPLPEQKAIATVLDKVRQAIEETEEVINATKELKKSMMKHLFTYGVIPLEETDKVKLKETEIGLIPEHWEVVKLGEIIHYKKGKKPKEVLDNWERDFLPYLTAEFFRTSKPSNFVDIKNDKSIEIVEPEDIVLIWDGSNAGDIFTGLKGVLASTMVKINILDKNKVSEKLIYYFLKTKFNILNTSTTGSTIPHVNKSIFENLLTPLPPLPEQKAITEILSKIDQKIEAEENKKEALKQLFKTLLNELMTGKIRVNEEFIKKFEG